MRVYRDQQNGIERVTYAPNLDLMELDIRVSEAEHLFDTDVIDKAEFERAMNAIAESDPVLWQRWKAQI
jgi:hypothetical protein